MRVRWFLLMAIVVFLVGIALTVLPVKPDEREVVYRMSMTVMEEAPNMTTHTFDDGEYEIWIVDRDTDLPENDYVSISISGERSVDVDSVHGYTFWVRDNITYEHHSSFAVHREDPYVLTVSVDDGFEKTTRDFDVDLLFVRWSRKTDSPWYWLGALVVVMGLGLLVLSPVMDGRKAD